MHELSVSHRIFQSAFQLNFTFLLSSHPVFLYRCFHVAATPLSFIISMADSPQQDDARVAALCQRLGRLWPDHGVDIWEDEVPTEKQKLNRR